MKKQLLTVLSLTLFTATIYSQGGNLGNISTGFNFLGFANFPGINSPLQIRNNFNNQIRLFTNNAERLRVFEFGISPSCPTGGGIGINASAIAPIAVPGSYLHIGTSIPTLNNLTGPGLFGWRNWMQLGTLMFDASDNMYVGLKNEAGLGNGDRYDAIINWGDNIAAGFLNPTPGPDYLRFIFTGSYAPGGNNSTAATTAGNANGLEVMRFAPIGNTGIGNFYNNPLFPFRDPSKRLEILSDKPTANVNGNPQLRITHTQQNPLILATTGLFTDFITTNTGDLAITTFNNTNATTGTQNFKQRFVGINTITPNNSLEINSQFALASTPNLQPASIFGAPTGWAGLRFTDLTSTSIVQANPNTVSNGVLSVDANGDVIYVPGGVNNADNGLSTNGPTAGLIHLGQNVGAVGNPGQLLNNRQIPMNNFNISFTDGVLASNNQNRIELGPFNPALASAFNPKLTSVNISANINRIGGWFSTVYNLPNVSLQNNPLYFGNIGGFRSIGVIALGVDTIHPAGRSVGSTNFAYQIGNGAGQGNSIAVSAKAVGVNNLLSIYGINSTAFGNASFLYGGYFNGNAQGSASANSYGVFGNAANGLFNYGIYGSAPSPNGTNTTNNNHYAGFFNGGVYSAQIILPSDELIKKDKNIITDAITKLSQLDPISFQFDTTVANPKGLSLPGGLQYGFKAQQVETVYPELVSKIYKAAELDSAGNVSKPSYDFKGINYIGFIALLTKAVQQQQTTIDSLTAKTTKQDSINNSLQSQINNIISTFSACCSNAGVRNTGITGNNPNQLNIELSDADVIVLNQNVPNPFAEQTIITYNVPVKYGFAQMIFKTLDGKIIRTVDITTKGKGQMNVFASDLSNGLYMYSLIVDGKLIDTKKMVKE